MAFKDEQLPKPLTSKNWDNHAMPEVGWGSQADNGEIISDDDWDSEADEGLTMEDLHS